MRRHIALGRPTARKWRHKDTAFEPASAKLDRAKKIGGHTVFLALRALIYERSAEDMVGRECSAWRLSVVKEAGTVWHFARIGTEPNRARIRGTRLWFNGDVILYLDGSRRGPGRLFGLLSLRPGAYTAIEFNGLAFDLDSDAASIQFRASSQRLFDLRLYLGRRNRPVFYRYGDVTARSYFWVPLQLK